MSDWFRIRGDQVEVKGGKEIFLLISKKPDTYESRETTSLTRFVLCKRMKDQFNECWKANLVGTNDIYLLHKDHFVPLRPGDIVQLIHDMAVEKTVVSKEDYLSLEAPYKGKSGQWKTIRYGDNKPIFGVEQKYMRRIYFD